MQNGFINGYTKDLPARRDILGMPQSPGNLGRFVGYTKTGSPGGEASLYRVGDWAMSLDGHIYVATVYTGPTFGWQWTDLVVAGMQAKLTTKGDLLGHDGSGNAVRVPVGTDGQVPMADAAAASGSGLIYANPRSGAETYLSRTGAISETIPRSQLNNVTTVLTSGTVVLTALYLPKDKLITNIGFWSGTTPAGTPTHWWFTLCNSARLTLRSTADQLTGAWAASTEQIKALSSTFTTTYEGLYYLGIMMAATTPISVAMASYVAVIASQSVPILTGTSSTAQTTAPPDGTTLTAITATDNFNYGYVS